MRNLAHYLPLYSGGAAPSFREEGMVFVSDLPLVSGEGPGKASVEMSGKTSDRILLLLASEPELTIAEVASRLGLSVRAIEMQVAQLTEHKRLIHVGAKKSGYWNVLDSGHAQPPTGVAESRETYTAIPSVETSVEMSGKSPGTRSGKTSGLSGKILILLAENPQLTLSEAATLLKVSTRTVERHVADLKERGLLARTGSRKDGCWAVAE